MRIKFNHILNFLLVAAIAAFIGRYLYMQPRFNSGENTPDFSASLLDGHSFELSELKGSYVLIDFWGSWCPPCRQENPALVNLYHKYKSEGEESQPTFEIVSVAIEKNETRWKRAIQQDQLIWQYHILDKAKNLRFFDSPIAKQFGVHQVPTKYLLSPEGTIIAVNPSIAEVDKILSEQL